jgi:hypothetical protein
MTSHSEEKEATAKGEFTPAGAQGFTVGAMTSTATTSTKTGKAVADSVSRVSDLVLAGGVIRIESVVSYAKAVSDGTAADAQGSTAIEGFTIADQAVTVTQDGVTLAGQPVPNPLGPAIDPVSAALKTLGVTISLSKPIVTKDGAHADVIAGGLIVAFDNAVILGNIPPEVRGNFPVDPTGKTTLVFGQASALADATPGFLDDVPADELPPVADIVDTGPGDVVPGDSVVLSSEVTASPAPGPAASPPVQQASASLPAASTPVGLGLVLLACVGAGAAAFGLRRLGTDLFQPIPVTACNQEKP